MQSVSKSLYPNPVYFALGKAADNGQKCAEYFVGVVGNGYDEMVHKGRTRFERFCLNLQTEVQGNKAEGSLSSTDEELIDRDNESKAIRQVLRTLWCDNAIERQVKSISYFVAKLSYTAVGSPIFVPLGMLSLPINSALQSKMNLVVGLRPHRVRTISVDDFSIATLNCSLFQRRLLNMWKGFEESLEWRATGVGRFLRSLGAQVICLQGTYHSHYAKKHLMARLQKRRYFSVLAVKPGLMTASLYPIKDAEYLPLKYREKTFELGVLLTTIMVAEDQHVVIANTRLIGHHENLAGRREIPDSINRKLLKQVRRLLWSYSHRLSYSVSDRLIAGDLGISQFSASSEFPLTRSVLNPEYNDISKVLLNPCKGLAYSDLTAVCSGTQLEPFSATFRNFLSIVSHSTYKTFKKRPIVIRSRTKRCGSWSVVVPCPCTSEIWDYFSASLTCQKRADAVANKYHWAPLIQKKVHQVLQQVCQEVIANLFTYPDRTDYICKAVKKTSLFLDEPSSVHTLVPLSELGIVCDKLAVCVHFQPV